MKLKKIYDFFIEHGKKTDPRGIKRIEKELA